MRKYAITLISAAAILCAQGGWNEFSIGPMTKAGGRYAKNSVSGPGVPLKKVISKTFDLPEHRILGPDWIQEQRYALTAVAPDAASFQTLMQRELESRFHFQSHREVRAITVYVVKVIPNLHMTPGAASSQANGTVNSGSSTGKVSIRGTQTTMKDFLDNLADTIDRPIFDETGLTGRFDLVLSWTQNDAASLKAAIKDQLGCDLSEETRNVDLLVIDHIEEPRFN